MVCPKFFFMFPKYDACKRFELLEIQIPANSTATRFPVPDQPQLRSDQTQDVITQSMQVYNVTDVPLSPNNVAVVSGANMKQTYLVLYIDGEESIFRIPLTDLHITNNLADPYQWEMDLFDNLQVDWSKSYFLTPAAYGGGAFATFSFLVGVRYRKLPPGTMGKIKQIEYVNYCKIQPPAM
jgi:hypothetical protein